MLQVSNYHHIFCCYIVLIFLNSSSCYHCKILTGMMFLGSSCEPDFLPLAMTCWNFRTHLFNLAVLLWHLQKIGLKFGLFSLSVGEAMAILLNILHSPDQTLFCFLRMFMVLYAVPRRWCFLFLGLFGPFNIWLLTFCVVIFHSTYHICWLTIILANLSCLIFDFFCWW